MPTLIPYFVGLILFTNDQLSLLELEYVLQVTLYCYWANRFYENIAQQIVSLGSGMDTTYFRIAQEYGHRMTGFFEVDFPTVMANKHRIIQSIPELSELAKGPLRLVSADLRCLDAVFLALKSANIIPNQTTIFYSECVVNYLKPSE